MHALKHTEGVFASAGERTCSNSYRKTELYGAETFLDPERLHVCSVTIQTLSSS